MGYLLLLMWPNRKCLSFSVTSEVLYDKYRKYQWGTTVIYNAVIYCYQSLCCPDNTNNAYCCWEKFKQF